MHPLGEILAEHPTRRVQVVAEGDGRTGGERELHVAPLLAAGVVDHGPALQERLALALLGEHYPVRRLPHRRLHHVAHHQVVGVRVVEADGHLHLLKHPLPCRSVEATVKLQREVAILQRHALDLAEPHDLQLLARHQRHLVIGAVRR